MKYLIVGAGAIGSCLAGFLTQAGKDVTLIARGESLTAIQEKGLTVRTSTGEEFVAPVRAIDGDLYNETPDVVIVCVKSYSLESIYPLLDRVCGPNTIIMPVLNALNIGDRIEGGMERKCRIIEAIAYVAVLLTAPGEVKKKLDFFRVVFGPRAGEEAQPELATIQADLQACGVTAEISHNMLQSELQKFVRVSTLSAAEVYFDTDAGGVRENAESMDFLVDLGNEIVSIANAAGMPFEGNPVAAMREAVLTVDANYITSLMHDVRRGNRTEADTQFFDVYELGRRYGLEMEAYGKVSRKLGHDPEPFGELHAAASTRT
jgi:2-dehydropantoate 2-reductase